MSGSGAHHSSSNHHGRGGGGGGGQSTRSFEDRSAAKEAMMQSVRDSSQQERRVYVGNLSYDVKWHHLKDFMRQGKHFSENPTYSHQFDRCFRKLIHLTPYSRRSPLCRCTLTAEWNVEGGLMKNTGVLVFSWFAFMGIWIDGVGLDVRGNM